MKGEVDSSTSMDVPEKPPPPGSEGDLDRVPTLPTDSQVHADPTNSASNGALTKVVLDDEDDEEEMEEDDGDFEEDEGTVGSAPPQKPVSIGVSKDDRKVTGAGGEGERTGGEVVYRLLCPASRSGSVIGKGGEIIKQLRADTGARIRVEEAAGGGAADERVITISAADLPHHASWSPAQEALFRVHSRIVEGDHEGDIPSGNASARLLVYSQQIGALIGKGGAIINSMREDTGAHIRVLPRELLPVCAHEDDELVQVLGEITVVRAALQNISARLRAHPVRAKLAAAAHHPYARSQILSGLGGLGALGSLAGLGGGVAGAVAGGAFPNHRLHQHHQHPAAAALHQPQVLPPMALQAPPPGTEIHYRMLAPTARTGTLIGRQGSTIRSLREESGARIKICDAVGECEERVVDIVSVEDGVSPVAPAQQAVLRVYQCLADADQGQGGGRMAARLLVPKSQVGCLLGRGGSIIESMRRDTGASIQVLPSDALPECAEEGDELVEIKGEYAPLCFVALRLVTARLRAYPPRDRTRVPQGEGSQPRTNGAAQGLQGGNGGVQRAPLGGGIYNGVGFAMPSNVGPGGGFGPGALGGMSTYGLDTNMGCLDFHGMGLGGARSAVSTVQIHVAANSVGGLIGKGGANIQQIRQFSGARIKLHNADQDAAQRTVEMSGTPEQVRRAE